MKSNSTAKNLFLTGLMLAAFFSNIPAASRAATVEQADFVSARRAANIPQTTDPVVSNLFLPFSYTVFVANGDSSEFVDFSGNIHLLVKVFFPTDPTLPPNPIRIRTNVMNVSGVGQTSGLTYRLSGTANSEFPASFPGSFSFATSYRLLPPNPVRETELSQNIKFNLSLNSAGEVTSAEALPGTIIIGE